jgi:hypothetical protein
MKIEGGDGRARSAKRDLFVELSDGFAALAESREGKRTLRTQAAKCEMAASAKSPAVNRKRDGREPLESAAPTPSRSRSTRES